VFQFLIALRDVKPLVWRRIQLPARYSFWDLHVAIQDAMGWTDSHLHRFEMTHAARPIQKEFGIPLDDPSPGVLVILPDWEVAIAMWFTKPKHRALYTYDYGDNWEHTVELEEIVPVERDVKYPRCVDGARACPPEDVGGPPGYAGFLEALADVKHERHHELVEWAGARFDPEAFDASSVKFDNPRTRWRKAFA
jgi:hypothetical protein